MSYEEFWEATPDETDALVECLERERQEREYHAALICSTIHNSSGHADGARGPEYYMANPPEQEEQPAEIRLAQARAYNKLIGAS